MKAQRPNAFERIEAAVSLCAGELEVGHRIGQTTEKTNTTRSFANSFTWESPAPALDSPLTLSSATRPAGPLRNRELREDCAGQLARGPRLDPRLIEEEAVRRTIVDSTRYSKKNFPFANSPL